MKLEREWNQKKNARLYANSNLIQLYKQRQQSIVLESMLELRHLDKSIHKSLAIIPPVISIHGAIESLLCQLSSISSLMLIWQSCDDSLRAHDT